MSRLHYQSGHLKVREEYRATRHLQRATADSTPSPPAGDAAGHE